MEFLRALVDPSFMPHGHCYFWRPEMVWLQVVSNLVIGLSYLSISLTLFALTRRLRPLPFHRAYLAFGVFIVACGATHFLDVVTVWKGVYWLDGGVRALTAIASATTALWLFPLFPQVTAFGELVAAERASSRAALSAREREFRELVDNLPDLAWSARPDGHIDLYNRRWYEYTGTTAAAMEGWGWRAVHHPDFLDDVTRRWKASLASGEPFEMEFPLRAADGAFRWFLTRVRPMHAEDGTISRWVGTNTDIEELRRARAAQERSIEARDEFIAVAAHELRTPLMALTLQLELAERRGSALVPEVAAHVRTATAQLGRLSTLVESMIDVSRFSLGTFALERTAVDLATLVAGVVERRRAEATRAGSAIEVHTTAAATGAWDAARLGQVLDKLLVNAIKYGEGRLIEVTIGSEGGDAVVDVRDHGMGIAAADQARIFERFERAVSARNFGGLGLGLFLCRSIVEAHGGTLSLESELGAGSRFRVTLPREVTA